MTTTPRWLMVAGLTAAAVALMVLVFLAFGSLSPDRQPRAGDATAPPSSVTAVDEQGPFRLELHAGKDRYAEGEIIDAVATLSYLGPDRQVTVWGGGSLLLFSLEQRDGPLAVHGAMDLPCIPYELVADAPVTTVYQKSGGWSEQDPHAEFHRLFFSDPELRLPGGTWEIMVTSGFDTGGSCGEGEHVGLSASVQVVVEGEPWSTEPRPSPKLPPPAMTQPPTELPPMGDCPWVVPEELPSGAPAGDGRLTDEFADLLLAVWGAGDDEVLQFAGHRSSIDATAVSHDPQRADELPDDSAWTTVRGQPALALGSLTPVETRLLDRPSLGWNEAGCPYIVYLPEHMTVEDVVEFAGRIGPAP